MYVPAHFAESRVDELHRLIAAHPLGALVVLGPQGLDADHVPFLLDAPKGAPARLIAHVARANPLWQHIADGAEVLVIFRAADAYISPHWYPTKQETHRQVPTWNYQVVHAHGILRIRDDAAFVRGVVARLTRIHEAEAGLAVPWKMSDSSKEFIDGMIGAIVGIEVEVTRLAGKSKLSQNREERDRLNAAGEVERRGGDVLAQAMRDAGH